MNIIGITGTLGAGKGTIVEYLCKNYGYKHYSVRNFLINIINSKGEVPDRDSFVKTANDLREQYGPAYIIQQLYKQALQSKTNCIIESIRTLGEINSLKQQDDFTLFAIDADIELRYSRIVVRASETDKISLETFIENENREMHSDDPNKQNLAACMNLADYTFKNNSSLDELYKQVDLAMKEIN